MTLLFLLRLVFLLRPMNARSLAKREGAHDVLEPIRLTKKIVSPLCSTRWLRLVFCGFFFGGNVTQAEDVSAKLPVGEWKLVFRDEFDGPDKVWEKAWAFQNGPSGHILCSRWRENAKVEKGILKLTAKKERRSGQDWTAASLWTKQKFQYGYFQCRYQYAKAKGTNNSFWLMTQGIARNQPGSFEIDINEGHYPNRINMNIHNWSGEHWSKSKSQMVEKANLADEFHIYGLEWNQRELIWYYDGKEIRREPNTICHGPAPVWLSLAIVDWAGPVTDAIHGKSMNVDYVRVYQKDTPASQRDDQSQTK